MDERAAMAQSCAEGLLSAVVRAGGSRHVVSSSAATLWRLLLAVPGPPEDLVAELELRQQHSGRALAEKMMAGALGTTPTLTGARRAARNVSQHACLGQGTDMLCQALQAPQSAQRGRRKASGPPSATTALDGDTTVSTLSEDDIAGIQKGEAFSDRPDLLAAEVVHNLVSIFSFSAEHVHVAEFPAWQPKHMLNAADSPDYQAAEVAVEFSTIFEHELAVEHTFSWLPKHLFIAASIYPEDATAETTDVDNFHGLSAILAASPLSHLRVLCRQGGLSAKGGRRSLAERAARFALEGDLSVREGKSPISFAQAVREGKSPEAEWDDD